MYSPEDVANARRGAAFHLEVSIRSVEPTRAQPGQAMVQGAVTRAWRSDGSLAAGAAVRFWIDTRLRGQRSPPGDDVRIDLEDLQSGRFIEAYFAPGRKPAGGATELTIALRQAGVYAAASDKPRL